MQGLPDHPQNRVFFDAPVGEMAVSVEMRGGFRATISKHALEHCLALRGFLTKVRRRCMIRTSPVRCSEGGSIRAHHGGRPLRPVRINGKSSFVFVIRILMGRPDAAHGLGPAASSQEYPDFLRLARVPKSVHMQLP
jgi:hypothetical protein